MYQCEDTLHIIFKGWQKEKNIFDSKYVSEAVESKNMKPKIMRKNYNWEKYFIALFHVSEHVDHFKAIKKFKRKNRN